MEWLACAMGRRGYAASGTSRLCSARIHWGILSTGGLEARQRRMLAIVTDSCIMETRNCKPANRQSWPCSPSSPVGIRTQCKVCTRGAAPRPAASSPSLLRAAPRPATRRSRPRSPACWKKGREMLASRLVAVAAHQRRAAGGARGERMGDASEV